MFKKSFKIDRNRKNMLRFIKSVGMNPNEVISFTGDARGITFNLAISKNGSSKTFEINFTDNIDELGN